MQYFVILAGRDGERRRTHRAASDQESALQEGASGDAPQDGMPFADPNVPKRPSSTWSGSRRRLRHTPKKSTSRLPRSASARAAWKCQRKPGAQDRNRLPARLLPLCQGWKGARVCGVLTAAGADPEAGMKYAKIIGEKEQAVESVNSTSLHCTVRRSFSATPTRWAYLATSCHAALGYAVKVSLDPPERPCARDGGAVTAGVSRHRARQRSQAAYREILDTGDEALLPGRRQRRALSSSKLLVHDH